MQKYTLKNLDCANCAVKIEDAVKKTPGVKFASVDFATTTLYLEADDLLQVKKTVEQVEPDVKVEVAGQGVAAVDSFDLKRELIPLFISTVLFVAGLIFAEPLTATPHGLGLIFVLGAAYLLSGWGVLARAVRNILHGQVFDEHFLMTVSTLGAMLIGEMHEAVAVMLFYLVGELLQNLSVNRSRRSIRALLEVRPSQANLLIGDQVNPVPPEAVKVGQTLLVKPGEKIPLDGVVLKGESLVDTSPLTGESAPRSVGSGQPVLAGTINQAGSLTIEVTRPFEESSISRILDLVERASSRKAATERFITRFARVYSPIVVFLALGVAVLPPLFTGASFTDWLYRALVILVVSCPCALVVSIPLGYFGGVGGAARRGVLVKGSNFLDILAGVKTVVFDKTGTLTKGNFRVTGICTKNGFSEMEVLRLAALAEAQSNHPIAQSIWEAYDGEIEALPLETREVPGLGVQAWVSGQAVVVGSDAILHREEIPHEQETCEVMGTVVHVAVDGIYAGCLTIADELKRDARQAVNDLRTAGVDRIVMLTGDSQDTAALVAGELGIEDYRAELMPEDKVNAVEQVMAEVGGEGRVAFVGDGINDAPALARADVGIAMGALGSEAAIETADVVIMTDTPSKVAQAIEVGRRTRRIVWQNILLAMVIKGVFISLGIAGEASMWQAVFGDMGVALLAVLNATRVLR
jgi:Cd2+/Zn2+-exporting ATPase